MLFDLRLRINIFWKLSNKYWYLPKGNKVVCEFVFWSPVLRKCQVQISVSTWIACCYSLSSCTGGSCPCLLRTHLALTGNCVKATAAEKERETKTPPLSRVLGQAKAKIGKIREKCHIHPYFAFTLLGL